MESHGMENVLALKETGGVCVCVNPLNFHMLL